MKFEDAVSLPEGPDRTAAQVAWFQGPFGGNEIPALEGKEPSPRKLERWAREGP